MKGDHAGLKKVPCGHPEQVDFYAGQVTIHSHLLNRLGPKQVISQLSQNMSDSDLSMASKI